MIGSEGHRPPVVPGESNLPSPDEPLRHFGMRQSWSLGLAIGCGVEGSGTGRWRQWF